MRRTGRSIQPRVTLLLEFGLPSPLCVSQMFATANQDQVPREFAKEAATAFLRPLRSLRLHSLQWEGNHPVQQTGPSRHVDSRCGCRTWLAPVDDLSVPHTP
jgi:hypothetical protein